MRGVSTLFIGVVLASAAVVGCGSSDNVSQDELQTATAAAAAQARQEEKVKDLQKQVNDLKKGGGTDTGSSSRSSSSDASSGGGQSCGGGIATLNGVTSCAFALAVADAYYSSGKQGTVAAYSPVTNTTYSMSCTAGHPHVCSGGNDAQVSVP